MKPSARPRTGKTRPPVAVDTSDFTKQSLPFLLLIALAVLVYANSFSVPFQFDDRYGIVQNDNIKKLSNLRAVLSSQFAGESRPLVNLSFALNYAWGALDPFGYHLVNLFLHALNGIIVYLLLRAIFQQSPLPQDRAVLSDSLSWPLVGAVVFVCHPVQTETVTYIWGRSDLLCTLFYLLSLWCFLQVSGTSALPPAKPQPAWRARLFYGGALLSFLLALGSKAVALSLPLTGLVFDYYFCSRGDRRKWVRNLCTYHLPFLLLAFARIGLHFAASSPLHDIPASDLGEIKSFRVAKPWNSRLDLFANVLTQSYAAVQYVGLLFFPVNLNADHDFPVLRSFAEGTVLISCGLLIVLVALIGVLYRRSRVASFGVCWVFTTMSFFFFFPLPDLFVERRLYLSSVGFCACAALLLRAFTRRMSQGWSRDTARGPALCLSAALVLVYALSTVQRNKVWQDPYLLWLDAAKKSPQKERPQVNLAVESVHRGKFTVAVAAAQAALQLNPAAEKAHYSLLDAYVGLQQWEPAVAHFRQALPKYPYYVIQWYIWRHKEIARHRQRFLQELTTFEQGLAENGDSGDSHAALGFLYATTLGDDQRALWHFETAAKSRLTHFHHQAIQEIIQDLRGNLAKGQPVQKPLEAAAAQGFLKQTD